MLEYLRSIPGPWFLLIFTIVLIVLVVIGRALRFFDGSPRFPIPGYQTFGPTAIAVLRGGTEEAIKLAVYRLHSSSLMLIGDMGVPASRYAFCLKSVPRGRVHVNDVEWIIYRSTSDWTRPADLLVTLSGPSRRQSIRGRCEAALAPVERTLLDNGLMKTPRMLLIGWLKFFVLMAILIALGVTKLAMGIYYGRPASFLFLMMLAYPYILYWAAAPKGRLTTRGQSYLNFLERYYKWAHDSMLYGDTLPGMDRTLIVAVYGIQAMRHCTGVAAVSAAFSVPAPPVGSSSGWDNDYDSWDFGSDWDFGGCGGGGGGGGFSGCGGCGGR